MSPARLEETPEDLNTALGEFNVVGMLDTIDHFDDGGENLSQYRTFMPGTPPSPAAQSVRATA
jgi:hypothetical protein